MDAINYDYGQRPLSGWGEGDLPAPYAIGDLIDIPEGAGALERMRGMGPGRYRVCAVYSVDEGDAWYVRVSPPESAARSSDRLHVACKDRSTWSENCDWLAGCTLAETADSEGLHRRNRMLAAGWELSGQARTVAAEARLPHISANLIRALRDELNDGIKHTEAVTRCIADLEAVLGNLWWLDIDFRQDEPPCRERDVHDEGDTGAGPGIGLTA